MVTTRTPIHRPSRQQISDAALDAFALMQKLDRQCKCPERDWDGTYWEFEECRACKKWWEQHLILHSELKMKFCV
jgi:hypothetical protein